MVAPPDLAGCPEHGLTDWRVYHYPDRTQQTCLVCRRERESATHNNGPRCRKAGHLKTPWTWRHYGPRQFGRCLTCHNSSRREKRDALRQAGAAEETAA